MVGNVGCKTAFVAHCDAHTFVMDDFFERMENLSAITHGFSEARCANGNDHELLQVQIVVGVCATVDHIHHWNGKLIGMHATKVAIQGQARLFSSSTCNRHGYSKNGIRT